MLIEGCLLWGLECLWRVAGVLAGVDADKGCYCGVRGGVAGRKMPAGPLTRPREKGGVGGRSLLCSGRGILYKM